MDFGDRFGASDLDQLLAETTRPCVSLFVPTRRAANERLRAPLVLKNLLSEAESQLQAIGARWDLIEELLGPAKKLQANGGLESGNSSGFAYFACPGAVRGYALPQALGPECSVGNRFLITPLVPLLDGDGLFYILSLSENHPRLYEASRFTIRPVKVPNMPKDMAAALWGDTHEKQLQRHGFGRPGAKGGGGGTFVHSTGPGTDMERHKTDLKRYFDIVDAAIAPLWKKKPAPALLAGVEYELPLYRQACSTGNLLKEELHGNFDRASLEDLHAKAWAMVRPHFEKEIAQAVDRFGVCSANGKSVAVVQKIEAAARAGRVDTLFITASPKSDSNPAEGPGALNELAVEVFDHGGRVFVVPTESMPTPSPAAAILRF